MITSDDYVSEHATASNKLQKSQAYAHECVDFVFYNY